MEERLRTARILASDDEEDEEHVARRRRTRTQIERDLNNPKVHKRIVENLYFAYKMRVRRRRLAFSLEFVAENKTFPKLSMCGVLGLNDLAPPRISLERFCGSSLLTTGGVRDPNDPMSHFAARARASIDRSIDAVCPPVERERERTTWKDPRDLSRWGKGRDRPRGGEETFLFLTWQIFFFFVFWDVVCVCVCVLEN